jgi:WXG100 family type VII secretion target
MTTFHIDSSAVSGTAATARAQIARIQSDIAALHTSLTGLQASWRGPAATAFQGVVSRWRQTQSRLEADLTVLNDALALASRQYAEMELAHVRMFQ